jgi:indole-3-acetate monooxygenase
MATAPAVSLDTVAGVEPLIRRHAANAECRREMAPEVMSAFVDAGLFRMWVPKAHGGQQADPDLALEVIEELARVDGSAGWVVSNCVTVALFHQFLPAETVDELLGDPGTVPCGAFWPPGTARATAGGHAISGNWSFASAARYATSLMVLTVLTNDDGPVLGDTDSPVQVVCFIDPNDVTFVDTWHSLGLRATGSTNFGVDKLLVPRDRSYVLGPWESTEGSFAAPLYRMGLIIDAVRIAQVGVGIAQGALDDFIDLATSKVPAYTVRLTADRETVQERVARAQALIQAAREALRATVREGWAAVQAGPRITGHRCLPMGLAAAFALDASVQAVDLLYESAGSTAFREECPLQRRFRDLQTLRQNAVTSWSRYESLGKLILGRPDDWPFHLL